MAFSTDDGDVELVEAAQRGQRDALDLLVRRHDGFVRRVVYANAGNRRDLDDVAQHVWTTVWQQIGTLVDPSRWRGWLYRLARNAAIDAGQKATRHRRRHVAIAGDNAMADGSGGPALAARRTEQHRRILDAVAGLPALYREPFVLRHLEDWSYARIAEVLSLPVDTVETRLVRARRLLRQALEDMSPARTRD